MKQNIATKMLLGGLNAIFGGPVDEQRKLMTRARSASPRGAGPGWTQNHVKRMAKKRKNRIRNRLAHRGARK